MARLSSKPGRVALGVVVLAAAAVGTALASGARDYSAQMAALNEIPVVSSTGSGGLTARLSNDGSSVDWELTYRDLEGTVTQSHIHLGQSNANGGVAVWLCSNLPSPPTPAGVAACPAPSGTVTGTFDASDVVGPAGQGVAPGEMDELLDLIAARATYVNVHTTKHPAGEMRGTLRPGKSSD